MFFAVVSVLLFAARPHRAVATSLATGGCYALLALAAVVSAAADEPSIAAKAVLFFAVLFLSCGRAVHSIALWLWLERSPATCSCEAEEVDGSELRVIGDVGSPKAVSTLFPAADAVGVPSSFVGSTALCCTAEAGFEVPMPYAHSEHPAAAPLSNTIADEPQRTAPTRDDVHTIGYIDTY